MNATIDRVPLSTAMGLPLNSYTMGPYRNCQANHVKVAASYLTQIGQEIRTLSSRAIGMTDRLLSSALTPEQRQCAQYVRSNNESLQKIAAELFKITGRSFPQPGNAPDPAIPAFDFKGMMARMDDDITIACTLLQMFLDDMPVQIEAFSSSIDSGDLKLLEFLEHKIKGFASCVGAEAMCAIVRDMERATHAGDIEELKQRIPDLQRSFLLLEEPMRQFICTAAHA